jgi:N-acetylglutamate synthase-like GNAT family acetyltransferase
MSNAISPIPKVDLSVRVATLGDVPFIDRLQKMHSKQVGFMKTKAIEGKIAAGHVIVATDALGERVGYCMGTDRYFKRDDVGIIYQLNVMPGAQRGFVGATLLRAMFERAAYGCRLFCCWCAQDIEANRFWEAMGFVPLAYRAGSEKRSRVHIFWQKRIRSGDNETPWWFPSQTTGGAMSADRLVLPIPPGRRWCDEMPVVMLPGFTTPLLPDETRSAASTKAKAKPAVVNSERKPVSTRGGLFFSRPVETKAAEKKPRERKPKAKNDPKLVAAARELKDRWLERVNAGEYLFENAGKYDVARAIESKSQAVQLPPTNALTLPSPGGRGKKMLAA